MKTFRMVAGLLLHSFRRISTVLRYSDTEAVGLWTGLITTVLGLHILTARYSLEIFPRTSVVLLQMLPKEVWGWLFVITGLLKLYGVVSERVSLRSLSTGMAVVMWWTISATFYMQSHRPVSVLMFTCMALVNSWLWYRAGMAVKREAGSYNSASVRSDGAAYNNPVDHVVKRKTAQRLHRSYVTKRPSRSVSPDPWKADRSRAET